jgi:hypothetical protein
VRNSGGCASAAVDVSGPWAVRNDVLGFADLGDPTADTGYALCAFDKTN